VAEKVGVNQRIYDHIQKNHQLKIDLKISFDFDFVEKFPDQFCWLICSRVD
jgi:hypothetical protein